MIADMHAHYPMHLLTDVDGDLTLAEMVSVRGRRKLTRALRAAVLKIASKGFNYQRWSGRPRVTIPLIREGEVRLVFSVLYLPFEEMDLSAWPDAGPRDSYFEALRLHLAEVERDVAQQGAEAALFARDAETLQRGLAEGKAVFLHCVEGGLFLGATPESVRANVAVLAEAGVAYVTLAHLFWRQVATNAPALPFLPDRLYALLFPQPAGAGLTELGRAAVEAMVQNGILVDVSHMRADALHETFALLDELDQAGDVPVIASHAGYRFGRQSYNLSDETLAEIRRRNGVVGLIMAQHQLNDGIRRRNTESLDESVGVIGRHIDRIAELTGGYDHIALGSDFDGFIKPTMGGLESIADLARLRTALRPRYSEDDLDKMTFGNALRVVETVWAARASA